MKEVGECEVELLVLELRAVVSSSSYTHDG